MLPCGRGDQRVCAVRILGPQPGARVRSGRVIPVVVRVSTVADDAGGEDFPEELRDGEALPVGWTLVLSQDGQPEQTAGRNVGYIGDLRGLADGVHSLRAWLADAAGRRQSADAATHFFVGSPRPAVSIMFPAPGAFVTDNPITVMFSAEEFEVPGDGFVVVSLDGADLCAAREQALFHCDLREVPEGNHSVAVTLFREIADGARRGEEVVAARHSVKFTVRRPAVAIVYPPPAALVRPEQELSTDTPAVRVKWAGAGKAASGADSDVAVSVRLTVQHVTEQAHSALLLRTQLSAPQWEGTGGEGVAEGGETWNHLQYIERADHFVVALLIPMRALLEAADSPNSSSSSSSPSTSAPLTLTVSLLAHPPSAYGLLGEQLGIARAKTGAGYVWDMVVGPEGNCTCVNAACDACEPLHQFHLLSQVFFIHARTRTHAHTHAIACGTCEPNP